MVHYKLIKCVTAWFLLLFITYAVRHGDVTVGKLGVVAANSMSSTDLEDGVTALRLEAP
jgi:hypothetical protein